VILKLIGTHQLLVLADGVNLLGDNIETIKVNTKTSSYISKEVSIEVNVEETNYAILSPEFGQIMTESWLTYPLKLFHS
jgi:hypothetical protein